MGVVVPLDRAGDISQRATRLACGVVAEHAAAVDIEGRVPHEALEALRSEGLLSVAGARAMGGEDASLAEVAGVTRILATSCASTAMIYAMHQIQVHCLIRHGDNDLLRQVLRDLVTGQTLLASATTELGIGGDVRTSLCALETDGTKVSLRKQAPVISYGDTADAVLVTVRRTPDSPPSDQLLVYCERPALQLEPTVEWETLGFRGTCSRGFSLSWTGSPQSVLTSPYGEISGQTMLPVSHVLWSAVWLGIAEAAAATAQRYVQGQARRQPGPTPPSAARLAELSAMLNQFRSLVDSGCARYHETLDDRDGSGSLAFAVAMNGLKVSTSTLVVEVVTKALGICGMAGYRLDSPFSLSRSLRDAHGAALMVNNDRINSNTAHLLLASKAM